MRIFPEPEVLSHDLEKGPELFKFYTSCANFSSVALIVHSESWCVKNNNKNKNNSKEGTTESVKGQRAVVPLTLIIYSFWVDPVRVDLGLGNIHILGFLDGHLEIFLMRAS